MIQETQYFSTFKAAEQKTVLHAIFFRATNAMNEPIIKFSKIV